MVILSRENVIVTPSIVLMATMRTVWQIYALYQLIAKQLQHIILLKTLLKHASLNVSARTTVIVIYGFAFPLAMPHISDKTLQDYVCQDAHLIYPLQNLNFTCASLDVLRLQSELSPKMLLINVYNRGTVQQVCMQKIRLERVLTIALRLPVWLMLMYM